MSFDYVRKIVSGNKARYIDESTATNLDLVYVTDRILIMGWPATGIASYYRNRRRDVLKFIISRHGEKWWIWNLCPLYENAYSPESMHNRVSRYPFPDHHPPPLALLPLAVREMTAWLEADPERVAIIHCKAGKGRSGTLLCSYLLSLPELPPPPRLSRSFSRHDRLPDTQTNNSWVIIGGGNQVAEIQLSDDEDDAAPTTSAQSGSDQVYPRTVASSLTTLSRASLTSSEGGGLTRPGYSPINVGDEAKPGACGQQDRGDGRVDDVFRLHSSRRMKPSSTRRGVSIPSQRRWVRYVHLLCSKQAPQAYLTPKRTVVRLDSIVFHLIALTSWQKPLASIFLGSSSGQGKAWASIARYEDDYVAQLETANGDVNEPQTSVSWGGVGGDGVHDSRKMFRSFGKLVSQSINPSGQLIAHHLVPLTPPLILDRRRECRLKFHLGSLPLGWAWLIPAFHLPEPVPPCTRSHVLTFPRSQIDFPLGPGQAIHHIEVRLSEIEEQEEAEGPARLYTDEEEKQAGVDDRQGEDLKEG